RFRGNDFAHQISADEAGTRDRFLYQAGVVEIDARDDALHRAARSQPANERPRVDASESHDAVPLQISFERLLRTKVARPLGKLLDNETGKMRFAAFDILVIDAVVSHLRVGHRDNLS